MQFTIQSFSAWLKTTEPSWVVLHYSWVWPAAETLHFIGLAMLVGVIGLMDLRLLGMAKRLPFAPLHQLLPFAISGFATCLTTGTLFFAGDPFQYIHNWVFWIKMLFIVVAGMNVLLFYVAGIFRKVKTFGTWRGRTAWGEGRRRRLVGSLDWGDVSGPDASIPGRCVLSVSTNAKNVLFTLLS
jgi:hypothetical protein